MNCFAVANTRCRAWFMLLVLLSTRAYFAEEFHDLDDQEPDTAGLSHQTTEETRYDVEAASNKPGQPHKPNRSNGIIHRFSEIVTHQVMNRFQLDQLSLPRFPFQLPWDTRTRSTKAGLNKDNKVSLLGMNNAKRIGALCPSEDAESEINLESSEDESLVVCQQKSDYSDHAVSWGSCKASDDTVDNTVLDDEIQAGMIIYVLPPSLASENRQETIDTSISTFHEDNQRHGSENDPQITASRCIVEMGKRYDANDEVAQYALIHREFHELGSVDVHRKDFAYHPVELNTFASDKAQPGWRAPYFSGEYKAHELESRITPDSEAMQILSTYDPGYSIRTDTDQQVSFRWWSWIDHFNQYFRRHHEFNTEGSLLDSGTAIAGSLNRDKQSAYGSNLYESEGKSFAGGSHGEIWRARRRCPTKRVDCDDKKDYIVKRLKIELGYDVLEAGLREVYFGELLAREAQASSLVTTYVDHFFREGGQKGQIELWIVFKDAGPSLRSFLYTSIVDADGGKS